MKIIADLEKLYSMFIKCVVNCLHRRAGFLSSCLCAVPLLLPLIPTEKIAQQSQSPPPIFVQHFPNTLQHFDTPLQKFLQGSEEDKDEGPGSRGCCAAAGGSQMGVEGTNSIGGLNLGWVYISDI